MAPHKTITINGRTYDAVTGLPVSTPAASSTPKKSSPTPKVAKPAVSARAPKPAGTPRPDVVRIPAPKTAVKKAAPARTAPLTPRSTTTAKNVHSSMQHSKTLNRRATKKPEAPNKPITRRPTVGRQMDVARSADVTRFAKHPVVATTAPKEAPAPAAKKASAKGKVTKKQVQAHPVAQRALSRTHAKKAAAPKTAKEVKDEAISRALAAPTPKPKKTPRGKKRSHRKLIIIGIILVALLGVSYAVYRLAPTLSVSVASAQAGISATYPEYIPDGYSLSQPVTYSEGQVDLKFQSNSNDNYYVITQTRSSWDSSAVLDNIVTPEAGADYVTTKERGLTIYTYDSVAVWVNGGILYKIDSKAPLSGDQIRRIATSL